jgi:asparagine synthase (glutamine-hydrolysing)
VPDSTGDITEKWILRKACEDLLPSELLWRKKAQFDEGSGMVGVLAEALSKITGRGAVLDREEEAALYERLLREQYADADLILECAGTWAANRVSA